MKSYIVLYMTTELGTFLENYKTTGQRDENGASIYTHTSLKPRASYTIPEDKRATLYKMVARSIYDRKLTSIAERPYKVKPITVDIDLKYAADYSTRQHTDDHIKELLKLYSEAIITYVELPEDYNIDAHVFQRKGPYPSNGNLKDGIHIIYPDICIDTTIQHIIRTEVLKKIDLFLDNPKLLKLNVKQENHDVVDKAVISSNAWMMYGCAKPGRQPYPLYKVYRLDNTGDTMAFIEQPLPSTKTLEDIEKLVSLYSIQNVEDDKTFRIQPELESELEAYEKKSTGRKATSKYSSAKYIKKQIKNTNDDEDVKVQIEEAKQLINLLAPWRAEDYHSWITVGLCLHNISPSLQDTWADWSKQSDHYKQGDENYWLSFSEKPTGLNIGSLHRWARLDNPQKYKEVRGGMLRPLMMCSVSGSSQDVAAVIHKMYKHQYVCLDGKGRRWAEFVNHGWRINEGMSLKKKIGNEVLNEYLLLVTHYNMTAIKHDDEQKERFLHRSKSLTEITYKLRDITFKEKIMKECIIMFHDLKFEESLNSNPYLIGTDNGVYDLSKGEFRDGQPEDRVSISTGCDFPEFDAEDIDVMNETSDIPAVEQIFEFMKQVFPIPEVRRYMFICLASYLEGYNREEKFHLWTGVGGNGKSKLLSLFEMAYGDYCFKLPINVLTRPRTSPGQATPELAMSKCRRFGSLQEPDEGAKINTGLMKEFSGNDKMYYRGLYDSGGIMKPQFSLVLLCNQKPKMTSEDEGTWRRLVVIEFVSRFVEGTPKGKFEFPRNTHLDQMFPEWAPYFLALLTEYYKVYKRDGLILPQAVKDATYDYRKESDAYAMFIDEYFHKDDTGTSVIKLDDSYGTFKDWFTNEFNEKPPARRAFKSYVERKLNQPYGRGNKSGWFGWALQHPEAVRENDVCELTEQEPVKVTLKKPIQITKKA